MIHNEYEQAIFYGEPTKWVKSGKFNIVMISKVSSKEVVSYKKYKCIDGWSQNPNICWQFSKQGAEKIIDRLKKEYRINYNKGLIEFKIEDGWVEV